ncbi:MAG: 2Fe-2S iron-sulfur cluster-binding protein, partial [Pseudomonadales bacterium]|nr:2Fe-2S iron-sulfur cluster-binding protein [Pseudomonadales bacterium]
MARMTKDVGDRIDRTTTVNFSFDGRSFSGLAGDTIASALLANGQWLVSRSFKYHRPRGVLSLSGDDGNTLVQLADEPNTNADRKLLQQDLKVEPQNCNGSLNHDPMAVLGLFSRFLPVGFYYKTFFRPAGAWAFWSKIIRKSAGLGKLDATYLSDGYTESESTNYDKQYLHTDTLVIGGGYHGMKAALGAAADGHFVLLVDREPTLGGAMNLDASLSELRDSLVAEVSAAENIRVETNTLCNGWYHDNWFALCSENRLYKVRAKESLVAVGALEQPAVFRNNDLPGVILGSAAQRMIQ